LDKYSEGLLYGFLLKLLA